MMSEEGSLVGSVDVAELEFRIRRTAANSEATDYRSLVAEGQTRRLTPQRVPVQLDPATRAFQRGRRLWLERQVPAAPADFDRIWLQWKQKPGLRQWLDEMMDCDVVVVNGEGSIRKNDWSGRAALFLGWLAKEKFGKSLIISNQMCDVTNPSMSAMVSAVYPLADRLMFRGMASLAACQALLPSVKGEYAPDAAFAYGHTEGQGLGALMRDGFLDWYPTSLGQLDLTMPYVCLGGSAIYQDGTAAGRDVELWFEALATSLSSVMQVVMMGHDAPDQVLFHRIARRTGTPVVGAQASIPLVALVLRGASVYVGGRWHSGVLAAGAGTPIVRLESNASVKSRDMDDFVVGPAVTHSLAARPDVEVLTSLVRDLADDEDLLRSRGKELVAEFPAGARRNIECWA